MKALEDIQNVFSILHDGTISAWSGDNDLLTLTVDCTYLAELIDQSFDLFYIELENIEILQFDPWLISNEDSMIFKSDLSDIFKAELEIMSGEIVENVVIVTCQQFDTNFDYDGGSLIINCQKIKVFDQNKNELTIGQLKEIANNYWNKIK